MLIKEHREHAVPTPHVNSPHAFTSLIVSIEYTHQGQFGHEYAENHPSFNCANFFYKLLKICWSDCWK